MKFKRNLLSVALASATLMVISPAMAQDTQDATSPTATGTKNVGTVKVRGIRRGIEAAISTKKNASEIVESVSAEDIGKLPDVSIAESIARLPGLAAQRVAGRAQVVSLRGLSPDFATTLLNGSEMVSTGDNRSVEFDQYPSELMAGVTVYKTPAADIVGQGLSGTIDLRTVRPLDFQEPVTAVGVRVTQNSLGSAANSDAMGTRFNISHISQSSDRRLGVAFGYAFSDNPIQEDQVGLYEPWQPIGAGWRPGVATGTYYSDGIKALRRTGNQKRNAAMGTLQFRATDFWDSTLDVYASRARQIDTANQIEINLSGWNGGYNPGLNWTNVQTNANGTLTSGVAHNIYPLVRGMYNNRKDEINAAAWNNTFKFGVGAKLSTDLTWSKANRDEINLENNTQLTPMPQLDNITLNISNDGFSQMQLGRNYSDPSKLFLTNTIYGSGWGKTPKVVDELRSARAVLSLPFADTAFFMSGVDIGLAYSDRKKDKRQPEGGINVGRQGDTAIASDLQYSPVDLGFAGIGTIPAWNVASAVARYMTFNPVETESWQIPNAWTVNEKIATGFVQGNIDSDWGNVRVRGNVGVQVQRVDQSSDSHYYDESQPVGQRVLPITRGKTYTEVLPSLNLAFGLANDQTIRLGLARQIARPRIDQLNAGVGFGVDRATGKPGGGGGNPMLDPWKADAFDLSYEKYWADKAYVALAYFYKDLKSYVYTQTVDGYDWSDFVRSWKPNPGDAPVKTLGTYTAPMNGKGGKLQGVEATVSVPFGLFTPALQGFGIQASASFNDSSIKIVEPSATGSVGNAPISLPGLSKNVYNLTAYYENSGFEARLSNRRRSDFVGEIGNFAGQRQLRMVKGENILDAQVGYAFPDGSSLKGLALQLQVSNLTNAAYQTYTGTTDRPLEYIKWGRTYSLGATYKF